MILVSYDGSADAYEAIDRAAQIMPGAETIVLTVWEPLVDTLTRTGSMGIGMGMAGTYADTERIDAASREAAFARATDGAERATAVGLVARPRCEQRRGGVAHTILTTADDVDASVIVVGTRGMSGVKSFFLGSVSHDVVHHADRAVLVVPSPTLAERRHHRVHPGAVPA